VRPSGIPVASARHAGTTTGPVILCYDGSKEAAEAIACAGELLAGRPALVVTAWKPIVEEALSPGMTPPVADPAEANKRQLAAAKRFAGQGTRLAADAGFDAEPLALRAEGPLWEAVEVVAEERDATVIVCGTRHSGVKAALPSNLASALVTHASRAVLVVPSAKAADERVRDVQEERSQRGAVPRAVAGAASRAKQIASAPRSRR
jgi:nucleotide-binding universal stress UspA family protein